MASEATILVVGTGVVGSALLELVRARLARRIRIFGVASTRGLVQAEAVAELRTRPRPAPPAQIEDAVLDRLAAENGILVDVTAAGDIAELYERALARGIHVVTANKKPLAGPWATRERLFDPSRRARGAQLRYSATVGAALPVIEALACIVRSGDRVRRIDCVLSSTLGFLSSLIAEETPLSTAIAIARQRGYTEPDPREDLRGADVARKAVIIARELGAKLETSDVALEPFLPRDVLDASTAETFDGDVLPLDATFASAAEQLRHRDEKRVYLAQIEVDAAGRISASAGPRAVPLSHPAAQLECPGALVAFTTAEHSSEPLVLRGWGSGGAVTASAVLVDVFAVAGPRAPGS